MSWPVTSRDYFAANAPIEIPEWFKHTTPKRNLPPMPDWKTLDPTHQELAQQWVSDDCFDLPEELRWFGRKVAEHRVALVAWKEEDEIARFFQWRWFYAAKMLAFAAKHS